MSNYILQKDIDFFGRKIKAGTIYVQKGDDYYWPVIDGAHVSAGQLDFYTVKNNPEWFKKDIVNVFELQEYKHPNEYNRCLFWFKFCTNKQIDLQKHVVAIEKAIESIINAE